MSQSRRICRSSENGTHVNDENDRVKDNEGSSRDISRKRKRDSSLRKDNSKILKQEEENTVENSTYKNNPVINSDSLKKVKQFVTVFLNNFQNYLEFEKPELLIAAIILHDIRLWEPVQNSLKLLMAAIIERNDLSNKLINAINSLSDRKVRETLKYTKREKIDKTSKHVKVPRLQIEKWKSVLVDDLEILNII